MLPRPPSVPLTPAVVGATDRERALALGQEALVDLLLRAMACVTAQARELAQADLDRAALRQELAAADRRYAELAAAIPRS